MRRNTGSSGRPSCRPWPPAALAPARGIRRSQRRGQGTISSQYGADIGITAYELDLFGRIQSLKDQALENYLAQVETRRSTQIALIASVANAYFTLLADQELLALSQATLATEQESYALTQHKHRLGAASEMELAQGRTALENARVSQAQYQRLVKQDRNGLALLLGTEVPVLATQPATLAEVKLAPIPVGHPPACCSSARTSWRRSTA